MTVDNPCLAAEVFLQYQVLLGPLGLLQGYFSCVFVGRRHDGHLHLGIAHEHHAIGQLVGVSARGVLVIEYGLGSWCMQNVEVLNLADVEVAAAVVGGNQCGEHSSGYRR